MAPSSSRSGAASAACSTCGVFAAWAVAASLVTGAAQAPRPVFRVSQDLVLVDLIATDAEGRPVSDLRADELLLEEEGRRQAIAALRFVEGRGAAGTLTEVAPPGSPREAAADPLAAANALAAPVADPAIVIALDVQTMRADVLSRTRQAVTEMLRTQVAQGTRLMLVTIERGLAVRQTLTADVDEVVRALEGVAPTADNESLNFDGFVEKVSQTCGDSPGGGDLLSARLQAVALGRFYVQDVKVQMSAALDGLGALARLLAPMPGRKHVVFYSVGYPAQVNDTVVEIIGTLCGDRQAVVEAMATSETLDAAIWMRSAFDDANRAQVSIYAVDPRGLVADNVQASQQGSVRAARRGDLPAIQRQATVIPQQFLRSVAGETGGRAFVNTNDIASGFRSATADTAQYYLLAYSPAGSRKNGRFYRIALKTTRPGVQLRYRQGYLWLDARQRAERDLALAMRFPSLYADPPIAVEAQAEGGRLKAVVFVPTRGLVFTPVGDEQHNEVSVAAMLRDASGKVVGERFLFSKDVSLRLKPARYQALRQSDDLEVPGDGPAPKAGTYELTVVVRHSGSRLAATSTTVRIQ